MTELKNTLTFDLSSNQKTHFCPGETIHCIVNLKLAHPIKEAELKIDFLGFEQTRLSQKETEVILQNIEY